MPDLNDIAVFVKVAQLGSFSRAAQALGMPVSTVSRKVASLEDQLGVTLMQRTTRKLSLTAQGRSYFDQCSEPLSRLFDAESALTLTQKKPEGALKVSVPVILGQEPFYEFVSAFLKKYPGIQVDLFITNLFVDLIADNIDVAIRFGELADLEHHRQAYREERPLPRRCRLSISRAEPCPSKPEDLRDHQCILLNGRNNETEWHLVSGRKSVKLARHGTGVEPGFSERQRLYLQGARHRSSAVELCEEPIEETWARSISAGVVVA